MNKRIYNAVVAFALVAGMPSDAYSQEPQLVRDFWPGGFNSFLNHGRPLGFREHGSSLLLFANDGGGANKLFRLDDLSGSVTELANVGGPAGYTTTNGGIITSGDNIYFYAQQAGTTNFLLWCVRPGQPAEQLALLPYSLLFAYAGIPLPQGKLLFPGHDAEGGFELWVTDGSAAGTHRVKDINPGTGTSFGSPFPAFQGFDFNGKGYFLANDGTNGPQLWVSDGTEAGTQPFATINEAGATGAVVMLWSKNNDKFIVTGHTGLIASDGTMAGTSVIHAGPYALAHIPGLNYHTADNGFMYFSALENSDWKLYRTQGTTATTELVLEDVVPNQGYPYMTELNGMLYAFWIDGDQNTELLRIDPVAHAVSVVKTFTSTQGINGITNFYGFRNDGEHFYFMGRADDHGRQYWKSDGTEPGTAMVHEFLPTVINGGPDAVDGNMIIFQDRFVYSANDETVGAELFAGEASVGLSEGASDPQALMVWAPASGLIQLRSTAGPIQQVLITDMAGRTVLDRPMAGELHVRMAHQLRPGVYCVSATTRQGRSVRKVFLD